MTASTTGAPWRTCAAPGCTGVTASRFDECLAHLTAARRAGVLLTITAGMPADFRGVPFSAELFDELVGTTRFLHNARFDRAQFLEDVTFSGAPDSTDWWVPSADAVFEGEASFLGAVFHGRADFGTARFRGPALFDGAVFEKDASFDGATFARSANFPRAHFRQYASFQAVEVAHPMTFSRARFDADFEGAIVCGGTVDLSGADAVQAVRLRVAAPALNCTAAVFAGPTDLQLRYAAVDLTDATLGGQTSLNWHLGPFALPYGETLDESELTGRRMPRLVSLRGVDAAQLMLTDIDLDECRFFGARNLDRIHMAGDCTFAHPSTGWTRVGPFPFRWSRRDAIADEHQWRFMATRHPRAAAWSNPEYDIPGVLVEPAHIADLYRQLRKALEDSKYEPGAADFYYGEMEMRRRDDRRTPRAERWLLHAYWLLSGYGLRASRALAWLALSMLVSVLLLLGLGLPDFDPGQTASGVVPPVGSTISLTVSTQDPRLTLPLARRFTASRADRALRIVLNSVVFRSGEQSLTAWGTYTEMASRFSEPVLLGLAALAVRGRIKRG